MISFREKAQGPVISNRIRMKFGRNVLHVHAQRLTESGRLIWRHSFKMASRRPLTQQSVVRRPSGWKWNVCHANMQQARQFLIGSTFVLVLTDLFIWN